jgi:hypothetical protein
MTAAIFALAGTLLGVFGTVMVELVRSRADSNHARHEAIRLACADLASALARLKEIAFELMRNPGDAALLSNLRGIHTEARGHYERLRLTVTSREAQRAGRFAIRYAYGLIRQVEGKPPREDEVERGPALMMHQALMDLYVAVRQETGVPQPGDLYREPDEWIGPDARRGVEASKDSPAHGNSNSPVAKQLPQIAIEQSPAPAHKHPAS